VLRVPYCDARKCQGGNDHSSEAERMAREYPEEEKLAKRFHAPIGRGGQLPTMRGKSGCVIFCVKTGEGR